MCARWLKVLVAVFAICVSVVAIATSARTADTKRQQGAFKVFSGKEVQAAKYVPGEVIVKFRDVASAGAIAAAHSAAGGRVIKAFGVGAARLHHLKLNPGIAVEDAVSRYQQNLAVEYAEPNYVYELSAIPNDPLFVSLWGLHNTGQAVNGLPGTAGVDIDAPEAWDIAAGSATVVIAVVDSGIAYDHPDLAANMWVNPGEVPNDGVDNDGNGLIDDVNGYDFLNNDSDPMDPPDPNGNPGHGTHVAGTIAAAGNNGVGVTGVMHAAKLMALKAGDVNTSLTVSAIIQAFDYARIKGARAVNASFGRTGGACSLAEYNAISALNAAGIMFIAAAGNANSNNDVTPNYPSGYSVTTPCGAALPNVIAVAAIDQNSNRASFSNFGAMSVQIAAPGVNINSTKPASSVTSPLIHNYDANPAGLGYAFSGVNSLWAFTDNAALSPPNSLSDSPAGNYVDNTSSFATGPVFSTVGQRGCRLVGAMRIESEADVDGMLLDVSADGGATWTTVNGVSGSTGGAFVAGALSDIRDRNATNRFRFHFISDGSITFDGVYLDDVRVNCTAGIPSATADYQFLLGTSMATPHVTGVVGLVLSANPNLTVAQLRNALLNTGIAVPALNGVVSTGRRLNARNAVASVVPNFSIAVNKGGTGTGIVTSAPVAFDCGATCQASFPIGQTVTLTAIPTGGSTFTGWSNGPCAGTGTCQLAADASVTASFAAGPGGVSAPSSEGGGGGGGGCTLARAGDHDAVMPVLLILSIGLAIWKVRRWSKSASARRHL